MDEINFRPLAMHDLRRAEDRAEDALSKARATGQELDDLRSQVDRLQMICEAMWTVIKARAGGQDDELARLVEQIDLRDGRLDGRDASARPRPTCTRCKRVVSVRTGVCLYCGAQNARTETF